MKVVIVDYGMGNILSVYKALKYVDSKVDVMVSAKPEEIVSADKVVFPGQGAMPECMRQINSLKLKNVLIEAAKTKPFLGICIGLQLLFFLSEEGNVEGLKLLKGKVSSLTKRAIKLSKNGKIPHMGWNKVLIQKKHDLWKNIDNNSFFYFVHSFFVEPFDKSIISAQTDYLFNFTVAIQSENIFAVQFHPEKSHDPGLQFIKNFLRWR